MRQFPFVVKVAGRQKWASIPPTHRNRRNSRVEGWMVKYPVLATGMLLQLVHACCASAQTLCQNTTAHYCTVHCWCVESNSDGATVILILFGTSKRRSTNERWREPCLILAVRVELDISQLCQSPILSFRPNTRDRENIAFAPETLSLSAQILAKWLSISQK